jgi:hypothetical protein
MKDRSYPDSHIKTPSSALTEFASYTDFKPALLRSSLQSEVIYYGSDGAPMPLLQENIYRGIIEVKYSKKSIP